MARRKKNKKKKTIFKLVGNRRNKRQGRLLWPVLRSTLKVLGVITVFAAIAAGFVYLAMYVKDGDKDRGYLKLANVPVWVNEQLKEKIYEAATAGGEDLQLDEHAAQRVQQNITSLVVWMDDVKVRTTHDSIHIKGMWRKPLAMVKEGRKTFYVDEDMVVLDFVKLANLPIVQVEGLSKIRRFAVPGEISLREDLAAAVAVLEQLDKMDELVTAEKPLLWEIQRIDMSNFDGRRDSSAPHIVLYTKDDTQILWGAEVGTWQRYLEATDEEKLAKLYSYYKSYGTLTGRARYINLRNPQDNVPQPADKY